MIEAVEVHEMQITKPVPVKLTHPFEVGIWLGMGFIVAPVVLILILMIVGTVFSGLAALFTW